MKGKKGNFSDIAHFIPTAIFIGIIAVITVLIISEFNTNIQSMDNETVPEIAKNASMNMESAASGGSDILFVFVLIIFFGFSIMAARLIPSSPKFIIIGLVSLFLLGMVALIAENIWNEFATNATTSPILAEMTFLPFILDNLSIVTIIYCVSVAIALLAKNEQTL